MADQLPLVLTAPQPELVLKFRAAGGRRHEAVSPDGIVHGSTFHAGEGCFHWYTRSTAGTSSTLQLALAEICTALGATQE